MDDRQDNDRLPFSYDQPRAETVYDKKPEPNKLDWKKPLFFFIATVFTTLVSGTLMKYPNPDVFWLILSSPSLLKEGIPFSVSMLSILMAHEMGHYLYGRWYQVRTSLPYFLPSPLLFLPFNPGTLGAVIITRAPYPNRQALMDIGAGGPIAGFIMLIPIMAYSLYISRIDLMPEAGGGIYFGEPLIFKLLLFLIHGPLPDGYTVYLEPIGFAAWFGCLVTMINLLPVGQLDGGHILYAFSGSNETARKLQKYLMYGSFLSLAVLGYFSPGFWFFGVMLLIMMRFFGGFKHPSPIDDYAPLPPHSKLLGIAAIIVLILTFMPVPIEVDFQ